MTPLLLFLSCLLVITLNTVDSFQCSVSAPSSLPSTTTLSLQYAESGSSSSPPDLRPEQICELLHKQSRSNLIELESVGMTDIPIVGRPDEPSSCAVLSPKRKRSNTDNYLIVPHCESLSGYDKDEKQMSRWQLFLQNAQVVNRDGGIFDNLPYTTWTAYHERDAANNAVAARYHMGKRTLYNSMMGKDWYKTRKAQWIEQGIKATKENSNGDDQLVLLQRMQELRIRELEMELASYESLLAVARQSQENDSELEAQRSECERKLNEAQQNLEQLSTSKRSLLDMIKDLLESDDQVNESNLESETLPVEAFDNSYRLLQALVANLLKADVVAVVLEDASWFLGTTLGGICILQRRTAMEQVNILGETVAVPNTEERFGNEKVAPGELFAVDCHADEALAMHVACGISLWMESHLYDLAGVQLLPVNKKKGKVEFRPEDEFLTLAYEGIPLSARTDPSTIAEIRIPRNALSRWEAALTGQQTNPLSSSKQVFPTDNPIQSLYQYDALSDKDKVQTLSQLSNFDSDNLPRPRSVRADPTVLDELLLPRIDESVRTQYLIRENGIELPKSQRLLAREKALRSLEQGDMEMFQFWEERANLDLRADVTQDEGSYSRFLDRDEWYELDRKRTSARVDKSKFGTLLDGLE